jgi:hypothetical protein
MDATTRGSLPRPGLAGIGCRAAAGRGARHRAASLVRLVAQLDAVSLCHSIERAPVDTKHVSRSRPIASDCLKNVFEVAALDFFKRRKVFEEAGRRVPTDVLQHG